MERQSEMTIKTAGEQGRFLLQMRTQDHQAIVELQGTVDVTAANQLTLALSRLADENIHDLVVDLTAAELVDSAAIAALVLAQKQARRRHGDLVLAGVTDRTRRVLEMTGLDRTFRVVDGGND
jgi:anti-sigma B factor antagonist